MAMAVAALCLASCSKGDDGSGNKDNTLVGTSWVCYETDGDDWYRDTFTFGSNGKVTWKSEWYDFGERGSETAKGSYRYDDPKLYLSFTFEDEIESYYGEIYDNELELRDQYGDTFVLFRKE